MGNNFFSREALQAWTVGLSLVLSTFVGLGIGYWLDKYFGTSPWLTLVFLFLGIISGFRELFRFAKKDNDGTDKKNL